MNSKQTQKRERSPTDAALGDFSGCDRSHGRVDGDDDDVNIRDEDEGDGSNERGVCDEDKDGYPSNHCSTSSPYNYDQSVKRKGFDTPIDPITRTKELCLYGTTE